MHPNTLAQKLGNALLHRIYLRGHHRQHMSRWLRCLLARTPFHRAWLYGWNGCFEQDGVRYGPANPYRDRDLVHNEDAAPELELFP